MTMLIAGVALWIIVHLIPGVARGLKARLIGAFGENGYKGVFSLALVGAVALIVFGWQSTEFVAVYEPPSWAYLVTALLVLAGVYLNAAMKNVAISRIIRHPQLTGVMAWSAGHLLINGDLRSVILFGGFGVWALIEQFVINGRDGAWVKPQPEPIRNEIISIAISVVVFVVIVFLHPYFTGMSAMPA